MISEGPQRPQQAISTIQSAQAHVMSQNAILCMWILPSSGENQTADTQ